jgi:hypothetical protein
MIRPFPCVRLARTQTAKVEATEARSALEYAYSLYPLSDISIITNSFLSA